MAASICAICVAEMAASLTVHRCLRRTEGLLNTVQTAQVMVAVNAACLVSTACLGNTLELEATVCHHVLKGCSCSIFLHTFALYFLATRWMGGDLCGFIWALQCAGTSQAQFRDMFDLWHESCPSMLGTCLSGLVGGHVWMMSK